MVSLLNDGTGKFTVADRLGGLPFYSFDLDAGIL